MKILKYLFFLLLIIFISGSIYIATKDGEFRSERSVVIAAPAKLIYNEVNNLKNWKKWFPWKQETVVVDFSEETTGPGAELHWESEELGSGLIKTEEVIPNKKISQLFSLETGLGVADAQLYWDIEKVKNGTKITQGLRGNLDFKEKFALFLQNTDISEVYPEKLQQGLEGLEKEILRKMAEYNINIDGLTEHSGGYYMYQTTATKMNEVYERAPEMIKQVARYMKKNNIPKSGEPIIVYNRRNETNGTTIFSAAIPTPNLVITPSGSSVLNGALPTQKVIKTTLKGNYKNATEAWEKTYEYIRENGLKLNPEGEAFEILVTTPAEEANPAKWVTEIYIPVIEEAEIEEK